MQAPVAEAPGPMPAKEANTAALASDELDSVSPQLSDPQAAPKIDVASFDEDIAAVNISESAPPSVISAPSKAIALPPSNPTPLSFKASSSQPRMSPMVSPSTLPSQGINSPLPVPVVTPARVPSPLAGSSSTRTPLLQVPTSPSFDDQAELATQPIVTAKRQASATEMDAVPTPPLKKRRRSSTAHSHTPARSTTSSSSTPGPVPVLATEGSTSAATDIPTAIPASSKSTANSAKVSAVSTPNPHMTPKPTAAAFLAARGMKKPTPNTDHQQGSTVTPKLAQNTSKGTPGSVSGGASKVGDSPAVGEVLSRLVGTKKIPKVDSAKTLPTTKITKKPQPSVPLLDPAEERRQWEKKRVEARERRQVEESQSFDLMEQSLIMKAFEDPFRVEVRGRQEEAATLYGGKYNLPRLQTYGSVFSLYPSPLVDTDVATEDAHTDHMVTEEHGALQNGSLIPTADHDMANRDT